MGERFEDALGETQNAYEAQPQTALAGLAGGITRSGPHVTDGGLCGVVRLEGELSDPAVAEQAQKALGGGVPDPGRAALVGELILLRLSSQELLVLTRYESAPDLASRINATFVDAGATAFLCASVSDAYALLRVAGPGAREALAKGAALDLHPRAFGAGDVAHTRIGPVEAILFAPHTGEPSADAPVALDLLAPRSQARSLFRWLADATARVDKTVAIPDL